MNERLAQFLAREYDGRAVVANPSPGEHPDENLWALLAEGLISPSQRDALLAHTQRCPACRRRMAVVVKDWDAAVTLADGAPAAGWSDAEAARAPATTTPQFPPLRALLRRPAFRFAMAACVLIVAGLGWYVAVGPASSSTDYGIAVAMLTPADAPLTALGVDLRRRGVRADIAPALSEQDYRAAIAKLRADLDRKDAPAEALALATRAALSARFFSDAVQYARRWTLAALDQAAAHNALGLALYQQNGFDAALAAFERAIALSPDRPDYHLNAALAADEADQIDVARQHLERFKALAPDDPRMADIDRWLRRLAP